MLKNYFSLDVRTDHINIKTENRPEDHIIFVNHDLAESEKGGLVEGLELIISALIVIAACARVVININSQRQADMNTKLIMISCIAVSFDPAT